MQVCVTGANGFIGKSLVDALCREGFSVRVLTRRLDCVFSSDIQVEVGDLTSPDCPVEQFLAGCDVLFHCAGEIRDVATMRLLHIDGTQRLLQAALKVAAKRGHAAHWVQLSSVGVYGPPQVGVRRERIITEDTPSCPVGEYEITKTRADELVIQASETGLLTCSIVRPSNVFGVTMSSQSLRGLIHVVKRGVFFYVGKPGAVATYVHVDDVVAALMKCAVEPRARGRIYNLSNDCLLEELIKHIASALGVRPPWLRIPEPLLRAAVGLVADRVNIPLTPSRIDALVNRTCYPAERIVSELGFRFSKPMPAAIEELVRECC